VLKLADTFPVTHYIAVQMSQYFIKTAEELGRGKIKFEYYPSEQAGKSRDMLTLTKAGTVDIGILNVGSMTDTFPMAGITELPGLFANSCEGTRGMMSLSRQGILAEKEFGPAGVKVLFGIAVAPYKLFTKNDKVSTIDGVKGLKIRTAGNAQDSTIRSLGAVPVRIPAPELNQAVSRGTVDGYLLPYLSARGYDLHNGRLTKFAVDGVSLGSTSSVYAISDQRWAQLPADVQDVLLKASAAAEDNLCKYIDREEDEWRKKFVEAGIEVHQLPAEAVKEWNARTEPVRARWVSQLEGAGRPAGAVIEQFLKFSKAR
jgi:TRAP-type C4-dicarboxylate transport system substrate-binding protein